MLTRLLQIIRPMPIMLEEAPQKCQIDANALTVNLSGVLQLVKERKQFANVFCDNSLASVDNVCM